MDPEVRAKRQGGRAAHAGRLKGKIHQIAALVEGEALADPHASLRIRVGESDVGGRLGRAEGDVFAGHCIEPSREPLLQLGVRDLHGRQADRKSTRLNSSHSQISYAVFCLKKKKKTE